MSNEGVKFSMMSWNINKCDGYKKTKGKCKENIENIVGQIKEFLDENNKEGVVLLQEVDPRNDFLCKFRSEIKKDDTMKILYPVKLKPCCKTNEDGEIQYVCYDEEEKKEEEKKKISRICTLVVAIVKKESGWVTIPPEESIFCKDYPDEGETKDSNKKNYRNRIVEIENKILCKRLMGLHMPLWRDNYGKQAVLTFRNRIIRFLNEEENGNIILSGDMNDYKNNAKSELKLVEEIEKCGYMDIVPEDAVTYMPAGTCIDHIFVRNEEHCICELIPKQYSDHVILRAELAADCMDSK